MIICPTCGEKIDLQGCDYCKEQEALYFGNLWSLDK
jgi:predicted RNA-binding Zn-ribbon protein involved in translation (DUF1610 family)